MNNKAAYHHGDLRTALIKATIEMINEQGVASITMRSLSDWVGVSRTAAYRHFDDKSALLTATAIEGFKQFSKALRVARLDESHDEISRFRMMGQAYIEFAMDNSAYYRLMFGDTVIQKNEELRTSCDEAFKELLLIIELLQQVNAICCEDPKNQAIYIWSLMHGLSSLVIDNKLQKNVELKDLMIFIDQQIQKSLSN
jgi:AcrR family transcriptional regulator